MLLRGKRWWVPVAGLGGLVLLAAGALVVLFVNRDEPGARSVDDALADFRADTQSEDTGSDNTGSDSTGSDSTGSDAANAGPPPGVYQLEGSGTETLSFPPLTQTDGATMPMTISGTEDGCWTTRIDFNEAHWQDWRLCREGDSVLESGGRTFQRWDLGATTVDNTSEFVCDPPVVFVELSAADGDTTQRSCTGTNEAVEGETVTAGTDTVIGHEEVTIGDETVDAVHVRSDQTASGAQTGTVVHELWFRSTDGLPLRGERSSTIESNSPIGPITYTETGVWQLMELEPAA